ncbi:MAG: protein kinase, partial [Betaproteobacteria bacterium]|nr:protein kinase [Betaproteobacteria bacterium]
MKNLGFWRSDSVPGLTVALPPGRHPVPEENAVRSYAGSAQRALGRYQLEQELGRGATGIVYRGRDPQTGRAVAIKTIALSREFEAGELQELRERFVRETATAGRLNHPHVVTIFEAGEAHDLAYIAMEFLQGTDLAPYTRP